MTATRDKISDWFDNGVSSGATHMLVVCDTFDHDDFPVYVGGSDMLARHVTVGEVVREHSSRDKMLKVMEVYDLRMDKEVQLNEERAYHVT